MQQSELFSAFGVEGQQEWSCLEAVEAAAAKGIKHEHEPRNRAIAAASTVLTFIVHSIVPRRFNRKSADELGTRYANMTAES